jgi:uncharacterized membrane protein
LRNMPVLYTLHITNTGNTPDMFAVTTSSVWPVAAPTTVGPLAANAGTDVVVTVTVPNTAMAGSTDVATVTVTSQGDASKLASSLLTTTALADYGLEIMPGIASQLGIPGMIVSYTVQVTNAGNIVDTFNVVLSGNAWTTVAPATVGPLAPDAVGNMLVVVNIPAGTLAGSSDGVTVTITSQGNALKSAVSTLTTVAAPVAGLMLTAEQAAITASIGTTATYRLWVFNIGNATDTFSVTVSGANWTTTAMPTTIGPLAAGNGGSAIVTVNIPSSAVNGTVDTAMITVTSQSNPAKSLSLTLETTAKGYRIFLPIAFKG